MKEDISLEELFRVLKNRSKIIVLFSLLGLMLSSLFTFFIVTPMYEASTRLVVNQTQNTNQTITNTDIQTNLNLINTYQSIIKEPIILEDVIADTGINLDVEDLKGKISVQTEINSLVFGVSVKDESPYISADLANAVAIAFQDKIGNILDVESVTILSEAVPNLNAVSPNTTVNLVIGLGLGIIIGIGLAFLAEFTDKRVKDSKIIEELGWTNLGSVLEMTNDEVKATRIDKKVRMPKLSPSLSRRV